jgi:hypothetical protein
LSKGKGFLVEKIALTERSGYFCEWLEPGGNERVAPISFQGGNVKHWLIALSLALLLVLASALPALAAADLAAALDYLRTQQNADGGFGSGFGPGSTVASTADAVLAIVAAGDDPAAFQKEGNSTLDYLAANAAAANTAGDLAKLILAAVAAGQNPRTFGGTDSVARLEAMAGSDGRYATANDTYVSHLLAVLALASVRRPISSPAVDQILQAQQENGGWAWDGSQATPADTNTTAFAVQALAAAGQAGSEAVANALDYYRPIQNEDGGWPYQNPSDYGTATDANSTAVSIQALIAAGQDPAAWESSGSATPVDSLEAFQNPSGAFAWQASMPADNLLATVQALPALAGKAFPLATMAVGEASAASAAAAAPAASAPAPSTAPVTGGASLDPALLLSLSGLGLAAAGYALRRRR